MKAITNLSVRIIERWLPDAFLFAIVLTIVVFIAAMIGTGVGPLQVLSYWGSDCWASRCKCAWLLCWVLLWRRRLW